MSDLQLTCAETPLAWPATSSVDDMRKCTTCGLFLLSPQPGTLQVLTRRQGGAGDGVNIEEATSVGADYRGQRYAYEESVFHTPGLHVFPGEKAVYPAEYHVHMRTLSEPKRYITIVIPVTHKIAQGPESEYWAAAAAQPDPSVTPPTLSTLLKTGTRILTYRGPDIRGRTGDDPTPDPQCSASPERQFLLILRPVSIRATDLERIPRVGSLSTDPRNLPAPGVKPTATVPRDRLLTTMVLADPGVLGAIEGMDPPPPAPITKELVCNPVVVENGEDVIKIGDNTVNIKKLIGGDGAGGGSGAIADGEPPKWIVGGIFFFMSLIGLFVADKLVSYLWRYLFDLQQGDDKWPTIKLWFYVLIALGTSFGANSILTTVSGFVDGPGPGPNDNPTS